jgi:hypothetical protein
MFVFRRVIREGTVRCRLHRSLGNFMMYRYRLSPLVAFAISNPISLIYLVIVILSFTTKYVHGSHLIDICNRICLTFLAAFATNQTASPHPTIRPSEYSYKTARSPPTRVSPLHPTPHQFLPYADTQDASLSNSVPGRKTHSRTPDSDSFLDLSSEQSFQGAVPPTVDLFPSLPYHHP